MIGTGLYEFAKKLFDETAGKRGALPREMTLETSRGGYKLKVIFKNYQYYDRHRVRFGHGLFGPGIVRSAVRRELPVP